MEFLLLLLLGIVVLIAIVSNKKRPKKFGTTPTSMKTENYIPREQIRTHETSNRGKDYVIINGVKWETKNLIVNGKEHFTYDEAMVAVRGQKRRLPSVDEIVESLFDKDKVSSKWTAENGMFGCRFTDNNSKASLFFPAVGARMYGNGDIHYMGETGSYWSNETKREIYANYLYLDDSGSILIHIDNRKAGFCIRCVVD